MIGLIYWILDVGYAFKYDGVGIGLVNIIFPFSLVWDGLMYVINLIHPGLK